jgi:hypothetical protein
MILVGPVVLVILMQFKIFKINRHGQSLRICCTHHGYTESQITVGAVLIQDDTKERAAVELALQWESGGSRVRKGSEMNRGLIGTIIGVLVVIILVIVILQLT